MDRLIDFIYDSYSRSVEKDFLPDAYIYPHTSTLHIAGRH